MADTATETNTAAPAMSMAQMLGEPEFSDTETAAETPAETPVEEPETKEASGDDADGEAGAKESGEEPAKEAPKDEGGAPKEDERVAAKFAALARKEREVRAAESGLKEREAKLSEWEKQQAAARENPEEALAALGWDYRKLTEYYLNDRKVPETLQVQREIAELKRQNEELAKKVQAKEDAENGLRKQQEHKQLLDDYQGNIDAVIAEAGDKYQLVKALGYGSHELVLDVSTRIASELGRMPTIQEALDAIQEWAEEQATAVERARGSTTVTASGATEAATTKAKSGNSKAGTKTLTNQAQSGVTTEVSLDEMDDEAAFRAILKKSKRMQ